MFAACQRDMRRSFGDPVATFSRILVEVNAGWDKAAPTPGTNPEIRRAHSSNHYDIDTSMKTLQRAIHSLFSAPALAGSNDGMDEDILRLDSG